MEEIIKKWEDKHTELLKDYEGFRGTHEGMLTHKRSRMKDVLEFIEDLKKIKEVSK